MTLPTLYKKAKTGKIQKWTIATFGDTLVISFGQDGGVMQEKREYILGKNIGRSNETSPEEQAKLEANSRWLKQIDRGYRENVSDLDKVEVSAMLSQDYNKKPHLITFPCLSSVKLDGCRCLAFKEDGVVRLKSRGNKEYHLPHIQEALALVMRDGDILDGELYTHGMMLQEIMSCVKKPNENTPHIEYLVFDIVNDNPYSERYKEIDARFGNIHSFPVSVVEHYVTGSEADMKEQHRKFVELGYEGIMLRNLDGLYESGKRSNNLSKYKEFADYECRILDVIEDRNNNGVFLLYDSVADNTFTCTYGSFDERKEQLANKTDYIGKALTVKYQSRYKDTNLPQFPTGVAVRDGVWQNNDFKPNE